MHFLYPIHVKRKELKIHQQTPDNRQQTPQTISYLKRLDKIQTQTHIDPNNQSETVRLPEMTSLGTRTQFHKERVTHAKDRAPHVAVMLSHDAISSLVGVWYYTVA